MEIFLVRVGKVRRAGLRVDDDMFNAASSLRIVAALTCVFTLLLFFNYYAPNLAPSQPYHLLQK